MLRILLALMLGLSTAAQANPPPSSIEEFVDAEMPASGAPGLAYAVIENGQIRASARGVKRVGGGGKVTADTPFVIGSITKSITALAVMQLVEADKVDLDTGISNYLEEFEGGPAADVTLRQLLSHTSGYSILQGNVNHEDLLGSEKELRRQVDRIAMWELAYPPGTRWEYSNANYQVAGALIEQVSGRDFANYVETEILQPLGMRSSFVADGDAHDGVAVGHRPWFGTKRPVADAKTNRIMAPPGGVFASANDLALYMAFMMNGTDDLISAESKALMMRPANDRSPFYGLGWFVDTEKGTISHSGSSPGVETLATMRPAEKKGVVVLVNAGSGIGFGETTQLRSGITNMALDIDYAGEGSRWQQKAMFIGMALLPLIFLISTVWAWFRRRDIRAKSGFFGLFSLWFPLLTTLGMAWAFFYLLPGLFGVSMGTLSLFQPDLTLSLQSSAATGIIWALFRLGIAYSGKPANN